MEMTVSQAVRAAYLPHPLTTAGRQVYTLPPKRNETLGGYLRRLGIEVDTHPHAILVNGHALGEAWAKYRLRKGDQILIRAVVRGGGGGGNKVLRTVAMIALVVAAVYTGGAAAAAWGAGWGAAAQAGVMIAGSMLVNAVLPPPTASAGALGNSGSVEQSPTYSLTGARNRVRQFEPMPLVLGKHRIVPDLAGQPYTLFEGQDQYLLQSFHFGLQADLQLSDFKIGETLLSDYQGVTVYHAGADGQLPAEFGNVDTESGREVAQVDGWISRTTSADCVGIGVDVQGIAYYARDDGGVDSQSIGYELQYRAVGAANWSNFGAGNFLLAGDAVNVVRISHFLQVGRGQYEIRIRKISADVDSTRQKSQLALAQLRSHQYDGADYTGQRRVGIKIKASSQLNGALDELSAVAQIAVPVWTGSAWVTQVSQNPAWLLLYFLRGGFINGRRAWGAGLPDSRIDIASIKQFAAWCDRKALTCSLVLDRAASIKSVAEQLARCGRAQLTWQSGRYGVVWDDDSLPYVATFGPANIVAGSFRVSYANGQMADEVIINFANAAKNWEADSVRKVVPGVINPGNPVTLDFVGCTSADPAGREANLLAAAQQLLRRKISWETDQEGLVASKGDVVMISHDMVSWSHSGRLLDGSRGALVLDKPVPLSAAGYVGIRFPDGRYYTYRVQPGAGESSTLQLRDLIPAADGYGPLPVPSESDAVPYDWLWFYDEAAQPGKLVKITDVAPTGDGFRFTAVDYLAEYYAAEATPYVYVPPRAANLPLLGWVALAESSRITVDKRRVPVLSASWPPVAGATQYRLRWRRAAGAWAEVSVAGTQWQADVEPGAYDVQVSPVFAGSIGAAVSDSITIVAAGAPPLAVASFTATGEAMQISLRWQYPAQADIASVALYGTPASGSKVLLASLAYPADRWVHAGLSVGASWQYELVLVDGWGNRSAAATASASAIQDSSLLMQQLQGAVGRGALDALVGGSIDQVPSLTALRDITVPALAGQVSQLAPALADLQQRVIPQLNAAGEAAAEAALRLVLDADKRAREARRNRRVLDAIIDVDPATGQIRLKATAEITTDVDAKIRDVLLLADALDGRLTGTVATVNAQGGRLSAAESQLQLLETQISLGVRQALAYTDTAVSSNAAGLADVQQQLGTLSETQLRAALGADEQRQAARGLKVSLAQAKLDIKATADELAAQASATLTLASRMGAAEAGLLVEQQVRSAADQATASQLSAMQAIIDSTGAAISDERSVRATADAALGLRIDTVQTVAADNAAAITATQTALADQTKAQASRSDTLQADYTRQADAAGNAALAAALAADKQASAARGTRVSVASLTRQQQATADALQAEVVVREQLAAQVGAVSAAVQSESVARSTADTALGLRIDTVQASAAANAAAIQSETTARATADTALGQRIDTVQADAAGAMAAVQEEASARATAVGAEATARQLLAVRVGEAEASVAEQAEVVDGLKAQKTLRVTAGGKIAGWAAYADANASAFDILADVFRVSLPDGSGSRQVFTVGSLNGGPAVGIAGDLILDGAMAARHVSADAANFVLLQAKSIWAQTGYIGALSELTANAGIVISGRLQNGPTLAASTAVIDLNARGSQPFLQVINRDSGRQDVLVTADGYVQVARQVVSEPDIRAAAPVGVDSGWLEPGAVWSYIIDTGYQSSTVWSDAASEQLVGAATISGGMSQNGGGTGLMQVDVLTGDGLSLGGGGYVDGRVYLKVTYQHAGAGQIRITQLKWKLARV